MKFFKKKTFLYSLLLSIFWGIYIATKQGKDFGSFMAWLLVVCFVTIPITYIATYFFLKYINKQIQHQLEIINLQKKDTNEKVGKDGFTSLMAASINQEIEEIKILISSGVDINETDAKGYTALMYAASVGSAISIKLLLELGADKNIQTKKGNTALYFADNNKHWTTKKILE